MWHTVGCAGWLEPGAREGGQEPDFSGSWRPGWKPVWGLYPPSSADGQGSDWIWWSVSFELSLEFYLGPNFSTSFPYLCRTSIQVYHSTPWGCMNLELIFALQTGMALVSSCQMHLGVNMTQAATWFIRVKSQRVFQLMKIKGGTTGNVCLCSSENSSDSVFTLT